MDETSKIWMDGKLVDWKEAKVHVLTHTLHYGLGAFEGIRFYKTEKGPAVFRLREHIKRLIKSSETSFMKLAFSEDELVNAVIETVKVNKVDAGYIRPLSFYGYGKMGLDPTDVPVNVVIAVWPWGRYLGEETVKVKTSSFIRIHPKTTHSDAKLCGHYINSIFASLEAKKDGFNEALLLDYKGNVAEGPGENIFCVKDDKLFTVALGNILPGITRESIMKVAKDEGIEVEEKILTLEDLKKADELFFTGTAAEITAIGQLDETKFDAPGPITVKLNKIFIDIVNGKNSKYEKWLSYVE